MILSYDDVIYFKFLSHVMKFNILFLNAKTINDFDQTIQNIFFNVFDENSQLFTKNAQTRNSFNIVIITQLQNWAQIDSKRLLDFFIQLRVDKNNDVQCIKNWNRLIRLYQKVKLNLENTKINFEIVEIKKKIRNQKSEIRNQKKKFKAIIKQLQIDNITFRKTFFSKKIMNKKKKR